MGMERKYPEDGSWLLASSYKLANLNILVFQRKKQLRDKDWPGGLSNMSEIRSFRSQKLAAALLRRHLLNHRQHQLAVAVVQADGVAANLAQEADFVVGELGKIFRAFGVSGFGEELRQSDFHGTGNFGQGIERGDGVSVFHSREVAAQQAGTFFDVALGHASLQTIVSDGLADVHRKSNQNRPPWMCCIVTRVVPSGKRNFVAPQPVMEVGTRNDYNSSSMYNAPAIGLWR